MALQLSRSGRGVRQEIDGKIPKMHCVHNVCTGKLLQSTHNPAQRLACHQALQPEFSLGTLTHLKLSWHLQTQEHALVRTYQIHKDK